MYKETDTGFKVERNGIISAAGLYDRFAPTLLGLCKRYCGNTEDAEDVLHDGFIKIIQNLGKFKPRSNGSFESWMKRIMVNTSLNHLRKKVKEKNFIDFDSLHEAINPEEQEEDNHFFSEITGKVTRDDLMAMICALPPGYRTVFNLYVFESYSHKEIAELLGFSENTSKSQLSKARSFLRRQLTQILVNKKINNG